MNDPTRTIREKAGDALITALTTAGYSTPSDRVVSNPDIDTPVPYIRVGTSTPPNDFKTKTTEGAETSHTFIGYGYTETDAYTMGALITNTLVRPATNLVLASPHRVMIIEQAGQGAPVTNERGGDKTIYGRPIRIRYTTSEA